MFKQGHLILSYLLLLLVTLPAIADTNERNIPLRTPVKWQDLVAQRQQAFLANPHAREFAKVPLLPQAIPELQSPNEAAPVSGLMVEWWCSSNGQYDLWDEMWMAIIAETVKNNATPYVYLYSYLGDDEATTLATCAQMLQEKENISQVDVVWIQDFNTDAFWIRDYGPFFVEHTGNSTLSIEDTKYYPGRPNDDAQPHDFADRYGYPIHDLNLFYEGGNFLPNGSGLCIASSVLLDANPHYNESEIRNLMKNYLGCEKLSIVQALDDAATGHVDMWLAWADQTTLLVGEYTRKQDPVNHDIIEKNVNEILSQLTVSDKDTPIQIRRVPMPSNCPPEVHYTGNGKFKIPKKAAPKCGHLASDKRVWRTYLNVTFVNETVIVPVYEQDTTYEAKAIGIWEDLGFNVRTVVSDHIAPYQGEIHCITKTIPDPI